MRVRGRYRTCGASLLLLSSDYKCETNTWLTVHDQLLRAS